MHHKYVLCVENQGNIIFHNFSLQLDDCLTNNNNNNI